MNTTEKNNVCPNCWGYQEYDDVQSELELCTCK